MKRALILVLTVTMLSATATAQEPKQFGSMVYPAPGNIDLDEGTVELWVVNDFDSQAKKFGATFFDFKSSATENWHYVVVFIGWGGQLAQIGYGKLQHSYCWSGPIKWKAGERHYVVWTWRGRSRSVYIDGKFGQSGPNDAPLQGEGRGRSSKDVEVEGWLVGNLTGAQLGVGIGNSALTVDEVRISSIARSSDEIARIYADGKAPARDPYTLLLDHCDGGAAEVISGFSGEKGAALSGAYKIIAGQFGKAIQLWKE